MGGQVMGFTLPALERLHASRLAIFRRAGVAGGRSTFSYAHTLRTATIAPPAATAGNRPGRSLVSKMSCG